MSNMSILAKRWFKFYDESGQPCIVLLNDIVSVFADGNLGCVIETIHGEYCCGDIANDVIYFLSSYFNYN